MTPPDDDAPKSDDDLLWQEVTKSVTPLGKRKKAEPPKNTRPVIRERHRDDLDTRTIFGAPADTSGPAQTGMGKRETRKIAKGTTTVDSAIDLHNDTREVAYRRLVRHIIDARARGEKLVLVVTGKGGRRFSQTEDLPIGQRRYEDFELGEGVLKQSLSGWLRGVDLNPHVAAFTQASAAHGGEGAYYVRLRRNRD